MEELLTRVGREWVKKQLGKRAKHWLVCERGFLDNENGASISDEFALQVLQEGATKELVAD